MIVVSATPVCILVLGIPLDDRISYPRVLMPSRVIGTLPTMEFVAGDAILDLKTGKFYSKVIVGFFLSRTLPPLVRPLSVKMISNGL